MNILAIDQGTSGTKAAVVDERGQVVGLAERPVRPDYGPDGSVEQNPEALWQSVLDAGLAAQAQAGVPLHAVSLANQGESVLAWQPGSGEPLTPVIGWQDTRSAPICAAMSEQADWLAERTGLMLDPYFTAPKLAWLRREVTSAGVVTTTDTWLLHRLTGEFVTDVTTASRSALLDLDTRTWGPDLLAAFGLEQEKLPEILACDAVVGHTAAFGGDLPVAGIIVDQQAALLAQGCLSAGQAKCTYGTGAFVLGNVGARGVRSTQGLTTSVAWATREGHAYCIDGQVFTVASAVRWLCDLGLLESAAQIDPLVAGLNGDAGPVLSVPALAGLAAPWWRSQALGSFTGLSLGTGRAHLVQAVLQGIAAQVAAVLDAVAGDLGQPLVSLRVDGGLTGCAALMQAQADIAQIPVEVSAAPHATAAGAAAVGALAMNPGLRLDQAVPPTPPSRIFEPRWTADQAADFRQRWQHTAEVTTG